MSVRAKVCKQFEHLKGVFDLNDEVEIIPKLSTERRVVSTKRIETWEGKPYASKLLKSIYKNVRCFTFNYIEDIA